MTAHDDDRKSVWLSFPMTLMGGLALVVGLLLGLYRPDRPVPHLPPGTALEPAFVVQVVRPRAGLPLGGLLPPSLFGVDGRLVRDSNSTDARIRYLGPGRLEVRADGWEMLLVYDDQGTVSPESYVIFDLLFEGQSRQVRCRPSDPVIGRLRLTPLEESQELAGSFDIELPHCEDAGTGVSLGWPAKPLLFRGSFDRVTAVADSP